MNNETMLYHIVTNHSPIISFFFQNIDVHVLLWQRRLLKEGRPLCVRLRQVHKWTPGRRTPQHSSWNSRRKIKQERRFSGRKIPLITKVRLDWILNLIGIGLEASFYILNRINNIFCICIVGLGKKKSKCCCQYTKPRKDLDCSSSEDEEDCDHCDHWLSCHHVSRASRGIQFWQWK